MAAHMSLARRRMAAAYDRSLRRAVLQAAAVRRRWWQRRRRGRCWALRGLGRFANPCSLQRCLLPALVHESQRKACSAGAIACWQGGPAAAGTPQAAPWTGGVAAAALGLLDGSNREVAALGLITAAADEMNFCSW
eukprot:CAMPEP_0115304878 /NCGR_PEP_ID=MMETSP0270-20121206/71707_1 /TAXON_ID=71861 /ORGANISM="Scrippsiella trochoidea, Strain CCMP3099" /LENGTH=135 /DNA_ID=CAMNT_0002723013 /DNA_START=53 /DNA_END=457 /DNA_ORIENTATION=-